MGNHELPCGVYGKDMFGLRGCDGENSHSTEQIENARQRYSKSGWSERVVVMNNLLKDRLDK